MDSSVSPTYGEQEGSAYNGPFGCTCYHPLFVFNQFGDLERCALRSGNAHSAEGWREVLEPVVARYRTTMKRRYFRADAAFAGPEVYAFLEAEDYGYVIRLPANAVLQCRIAHLLKRPVGRPPCTLRRRLVATSCKLARRASSLGATSRLPVPRAPSWDMCPNGLAMTQAQ
jgi:Transposase DDE domain group 1